MKCFRQRFCKRLAIQKSEKGFYCSDKYSVLCNMYSSILRACWRVAACMRCAGQLMKKRRDSSLIESNKKKGEFFHWIIWTMVLSIFSLSILRTRSLILSFRMKRISYPFIAFIHFSSMQDRTNRLYRLRTVALLSTVLPIINPYLG